MNKLVGHSDADIIDGGEESRLAYGTGYGADLLLLNVEQLQALLDGKQLAAGVRENEYTLFIELAPNVRASVVDMNEIKGLVLKMRKVLQRYP